MSARPWYKRFPADFIAGTLALSLEEKGAYSMVLDLIYDHQGPIKNNERFIAGILGVSLRKYRKILFTLVESGHLHFNEDGNIYSRTVDKWQKFTFGRQAIPVDVRNEVIGRDGEVCQYCGTEDGPFHLDHIFPVSRGGKNTVENLTVACASCNLSKGPKTVQEWLN